MNTSSKLLLRLECMSCDQCNGSPKELQTATRLCVDQTPTSQANQSKKKKRKKKGLFPCDSLEWSVSRPSSTLSHITIRLCWDLAQLYPLYITTKTAQMRAKNCSIIESHTTPCQCMQGFNQGISKTRIWTIKVCLYVRIRVSTSKPDMSFTTCELPLNWWATLFVQQLRNRANKKHWNLGYLICYRA